MSSVITKPRQRAWKPKNRNGCKTCKIRKVKCDEEKPFCKRCTTTGRKCDGYDPNFRPPAPNPPSPPTASTINGKLSPTSSVERHKRSPSPLALAPALHFSTPEEQQSFEFFTSHAISYLRGFLDSPFWQREILQAAHRDTAIQHCVIALGAMHRRFYEGRDSHIKEDQMSDKYLQFALRKSNQAIQDLLKKQNSNGKMARSDTITLMTCSVLFSNMSCLQGYQRDALEHLKSGIRMLNAWDKEENDKPEDHPIDVDSLRSIFVGLDMQARSIMPAAQFKNWVARPNAKDPSTLPTAELNMQSLLVLLKYFESLLNHVHALFQGTSSGHGADKTQFFLDYRSLATRFNFGNRILKSLLNKAATRWDEFTQALTALQLLHCQTEYLMRCPRSDFAVKFDFIDNLFDDPFDDTTQLLKMFEYATRLLPISSDVSPIFTTNMGPLSALWLVATRAPSMLTALRKRAVRIMLSHPRREGFWDGMVAGQLAQKALELEQEATRAELGLSDFTEDLIIPKDLRMLIVAISYAEDDDRRAMVEYSNSRDIAAGRPGFVQWITW